MNLAAPPVFRPEDFPNTEPLLLQQLTRGFRQLYDAISTLPERGTIEQRGFTTETSGTSDVEVAFTTSSRPEHLVVTDVYRDDGLPLTAAYGVQWKRKESSLVVTFIGLPTSTKMHFSAEYF